MKVFFLRFIKNKFIITSIVFVIYSFFLDENDIFKILDNREKLRELTDIENQKKSKFKKNEELLTSLNDIENIENYARSKKFFKKDDEEIFVITKN